jgi:hypothetical protein
VDRELDEDEFSSPDWLNTDASAHFVTIYYVWRIKLSVTLHAEVVDAATNLNLGENGSGDADELLLNSSSCGSKSNCLDAAR